MEKVKLASMTSGQALSVFLKYLSEQEVARIVRGAVLTSDAGRYSSLQRGCLGLKS